MSFDFKNYVEQSIKMKNFQILPSEIATGNVAKITYCGNLEQDGYEYGFLYLPKGSSILEHKHTDNIEMYKIIEGELSVNGKEVSTQICLINCTHNIDPVSCKTIVETLKINKRLSKKNNQNDINQELKNKLDAVYSEIENVLSNLNNNVLSNLNNSLDKEKIQKKLSLLLTRIN